MIKLTRVDHRLLHGQVALTWTMAIGTNCLLIANDALMGDPLKMSALKLARPDGVKLVMKNIEDSIKAINSGVTDKYNLFIVVASIEDAYKLAIGCKSVDHINLGGLKSDPSKKQISKTICVDENDIKMLKELHEKGVELEIRQVPNDSKQDVIKLID